jgi:ABC-type nitrate/sulfonate/bicarbonate transport system permease component
MKLRKPQNRLLEVAISIIGALVPLLIWILIKVAFKVSDRYLPSPLAVVTAFRDIEPSIILHAGVTVIRLVVGGVAGVTVGIGGAILMYHRPTVGKLLTPTVQALRSVPPVATVPFFLLWFGFDETGKFILILLGIGLNVLVAAHQILVEMPDKHRVALLSFGYSPRSFPFIVSLPLILERILPSLRTSLSIAFGVVLVAELLGSQLGLGYVIQTSRTTYAIHVIFLVALVLGFLNVALDRILTLLWNHLVYWRRDLRQRSYT